jgi:hypothetical protein
MAIAVMVEIPGGTEQQYEQIIASVSPDGKLPEGWLVHIASASEYGRRIVNVVNHRRSSRNLPASDSAQPSNG